MLGEFFTSIPETTDWADLAVALSCSPSKKRPTGAEEVSQEMREVRYTVLDENGDVIRQFSMPDSRLVLQELESAPFGLTGEEPD